MFWIALALLMIGLAFVIILLLNSKDESESPSTTDPLLKSQSSALPEFIRTYLLANGVELPVQVVYGALAIASVACLLSIILLPLTLSGLIAIGIIAILLLMTKTLGAQRRKKMLEQLPSFINQVTRRLSAGISVENAFSDSVETLEAPLGTVMRRVIRKVHMGEELHKAFDHEAKLNKLHELNVLATAIRINEQYGGSIRSILEDIVSILRLDENGKKELAAMTGETRFTAVVLAILPVGIAGYMFSSNPDLLLGMWESSGGQKALLGAVIMEIVGVVVMWRMVKSIGA